MLVFYKNWQGIGESPVRNEFHREASNAHDALLVAKTRKMLLLWTCIYIMDVENTSIYGAKTLTPWRHNVFRKLARVSVNPMRVLQLIGQSNYV